MFMESFFKLTTLQVGVSILSFVFFLVAWIVLAVNVFNYYDDSTIGWPAPLVFIVIFVALMTVSGIVMFLASYKESRRNSLSALVLVVLMTMFWLILSFMSFTSDFNNLKMVCNHLKCPESFWLAEIPHGGFRKITIKCKIMKFVLFEEETIATTITKTITTTEETETTTTTTEGIIPTTTEETIKTTTDETIKITTEKTIPTTTEVPILTTTEETIPTTTEAPIITTTTIRTTTTTIPKTSTEATTRTKITEEKPTTLSTTKTKEITTTTSTTVTTASEETSTTISEMPTTIETTEAETKTPTEERTVNSTITTTSKSATQTTTSTPPSTEIYYDLTTEFADDAGGITGAKRKREIIYTPELGSEFKTVAYVITHPFLKVTPVTPLKSSNKLQNEDGIYSEEKKYSPHRDSNHYVFGQKYFGAYVLLITNLIFLLFSALTLWSYSQELWWLHQYENTTSVDNFYLK